jgi:hypothetical protein
LPDSQNKAIRENRPVWHNWQDRRDKKKKNRESIIDLKMITAMLID